MVKKSNDISDSVVMVADDDLFLAALISSIMDTKGIKHYIAKDGYEAHKIYERSLRKGAGVDPIDIVLMDLHMPNMDGYESTLRIMEMDPDARIIYHSSKHANEVPKEWYDSGVIDHIPKINNASQLIDTIKKYSKKYASKDYIDGNRIQVLKNKAM